MNDVAQLFAQSFVPSSGMSLLTMVVGMFGSSPLEIVAVLLGIANIALLMRRNIWNYPVGMLMVSLYGFIFFEARLYSDMLLQGFFFALQAYGWWYWLQDMPASGQIQVRRLPLRDYPLYAVAAVLGIAALGTFMSRLTDADLAYADATTSVLSIQAQILLARRRLENWLLWIVVDMLAIGIYFVKGLYPTMLLYGVFLVMASGGLVSWWRAWHAATVDQAGHGT